MRLRLASGVVAAVVACDQQAVGWQRCTPCFCPRWWTDGQRSTRLQSQVSAAGGGCEPCALARWRARGRRPWTTPLLRGRRAV